MTFEECEDYLSPEEMPQRAMCAHSPGKATCLGDSGGPLVTKIDGKYHLIGIVSFRNYETCDGITPSYFASVTDQLDWIMDQIKGRQCPP